MEIILAVVVGAAVIFFGALISIGNDRQCKAIDALREQTELWAMQDIKIKRERLAREIRMDDSLGWFNKIVTKLFGYDLKIQVVEFLDKPFTLLCTSEDRKISIVFSPLSPSEIRALKYIRRSRLDQLASGNPLYSLPRKVTKFEVSVLNGGMMFDLELPLAWKGLTGQTVDRMERIWIYAYIGK